VEWVETIGKTVEEAVEAALEQLGVAEKDVEIVVVEEPKSGMFGLRKSSARIRARVRPVQPRAKRPSHRPRSGVGTSERGHRRQGGRPESPARKAVEKSETDEPRSRASGAAARTQRGQAQTSAQNGSKSSRSRAEPDRGQAADSTADEAGTRPSGARRRSRGRGGRDRLSNGSESSAETSGGARRGTGSPKEAEMSIETQQQLATDFVKEVVARFGIDATTSARRSEDDGIYISVEGDNLGLLVGPKGATVEALQELTRTVVQRHTDEHTSRIVVDVGGYRERRAAALRQFVIEAGADVLRTGIPEALEPMSPSDRKVVHDTVNELEGLETTSEGVEPRRYVVIRPTSAPQATDTPDDADSADESEDDATEPADLS
jgi:spoIIIJ-associated protein